MLLVSHEMHLNFANCWAGSGTGLATDSGTCLPFNLYRRGRIESFIDNGFRADQVLKRQNSCLARELLQICKHGTCREQLFSRCDKLGTT